MSRAISLVILVGFVVALAPDAAAQREAAKPQQAQPDHRMGLYRPQDIKWTAGPASLPPGASMAVLEGDPAKAGTFTMRARLPDGYRIPPHWHPRLERVTVLSGTFHLGMGERFDESAARALPAGGFFYMEPGMRHFAWTKGETVIQLTGESPWEINYVNPEDDPRKRK